MNSPGEEKDLQGTSLEDYDFHLPPELIAQEPAATRDGSRLLVLHRESGSIEHRRFPDIRDYLQAGDLLVANRTRVIPARLFGSRRVTGGRAEILLVSPRGDGLWDALVKTRCKIQAGEWLDLAEGELQVQLIEPFARGRWSMRLQSETDEPMRVVDRAGVMPLPPYIKRELENDPRSAMDRERYQTVFATEPGAVAAPTAGLHFTPEILQDLEAKAVERTEVTLHVGLGTFAPIEIDDFNRHEMHEERYVVTSACAQALNRCRERGGRVVAIGTTSVRSLESAWNAATNRVEARDGTTKIFIHPPKKVRSVDALITNFHLPKSTLMLLVSAMAGREKILHAYAEAVKEGYRFFSYGDAMLIV